MGEKVQNMETLYTIGYSGFPDIREFINTLHDNGIRLLIDVRSNPKATEYFAQYSEDYLEKTLEKEGIKYRNFKEFGARQDDRSYYNTEGLEGKLDFEKYAESDEFAKGVKNVRWALEHKYPPVLMCAEKDPFDCHRAIMITRKLNEMGIPICHLLPDKKTKSQQDIENELREKYYKNQFSMLDSDDDLIRNAYFKRNIDIGYTFKGNGENQ